jgi:hypothetical protein
MGEPQLVAVLAFRSRQLPFSHGRDMISLEAGAGEFVLRRIPSLAARRHRQWFRMAQAM